MARPTEPAADVGRRSKAFRTYLLLLAGILAAMLFAGFLPSRRLAGEAGVLGMVAGSGASLVGSLVAGWWLRSRPKATTAANVVGRVMGALGMRLGVTVALGAALLGSGAFAPGPLLLWLAISHGVLLVADTRFALAVAGEIGAEPAA